MTKSLIEIYEDLNNLKKLEDEKESNQTIVRKSKTAKELIDNNRAFHIEGAEEFLKKYIEEVTKLEQKAKSALLHGVENKIGDKLDILFKEYMSAIQSENKEGFIKHDVIMKIEVDKGYSLHLDLLTKKINKYENVNIFNKFGFNENESETRVIFLTMTGTDFIKIGALVKEEKEKTGVNFMPEVSMLCVDTKQRTKSEHNADLLSRMENYDDREYLPYIGEKVGYFSHKQKFNWYLDNFEEFVKSNFIKSYEYSRAFHNESLLKNGTSVDNYVISFKNIEHGNPTVGFKEVPYNPLTEVEVLEQSRKNSNIQSKTKKITP